jgi:hypothetical protein
VKIQTGEQRRQIHDMISLSCAAIHLVAQSCCSLYCNITANPCYFSQHDFSQHEFSQHEFLQHDTDQATSS